jgi:hypothetical protein
MYATVTWRIDSNSTNSADIKNAVDNAFGTLTTTLLMANVRIALLRRTADLGSIGKRLEAIHAKFPTEFDYVCVGSEGGTPLAPDSRPTWDEEAVEEITAVDA